MPSTVTLRWVTEDNAHHAATVNIPALSSDQPTSVRYSFALFPEGRANVAVTDNSMSVDQCIDIENELGCDGGPNYRVAVKNVTGLDAKKVAVRFGSHLVNAGTHVNSTGQNYSIARGLPYPLTESADIYWTTSDGREWSDEVNLIDLYSTELSDHCLWFILGTNGDVTFQIVLWDDLRAGHHPNLCRGF
ncbi:MAG: hypothetical protein Rhob2KO_53850 [Rhodopirellula baltica]